jgi:hypothetical protein
VYKLCRHKICGGSAPAPPAETAVSALCIRILSTLTRVFASLFAKSEWVSGQRPENLKKRKTCFAHSLQMSVFKKWWVRATPDYHYRDFAKAVKLPLLVLDNLL